MAEQTFDKATRFLYYTDLHYINPEEKKDPLWAASNLVFIKYNSAPFVDADKVKKFRDIDNGEIIERDYKLLFDPIDPVTKKGGTADYVAADWKANPIHIHINNIVEANLEKIPINLYCKAVDEYAMLKQQRENHQIIGRREFMSFLNEMNVKLGLPKLKSTDDPFKYAERMARGAAEPPKTGSKKMEIVDAPTGLLESIKAAINDNEDLALFNEFIYKGDVEIAIELGMQYYFKKNKFPRIGERIIADIRNFNRACGRWYTSLTTGRPIMEYLDPALVRVSPFKEPDGKDIVYWFIEYDVTFGDFVKMFGKNLDKSQLQIIFERNKSNQAMHSREWDRCSSGQRDAARIRIGYAEWLSQDCDVFSNGEVNGNLSYNKKPFGWNMSKYSNKKRKKEEKHYNVWYKCYYTPLRGLQDAQGSVQISEFIDQSKYIFDFGKVQDQQRYDDDDRNACCSLVVWKRKGMSFAEVMERYMPKIHFQWMKYQNYLVQNDVYKIYANELLEAMMQISDDGDKKSTSGDKMEWLKMLEQTGKGVSKMTDNKGNPIDPIKVFKVGYGAAGLECLNNIQALYNQMTIALSISDVREGIDPKPRTSLGGIQLSLAASNNGTYFVEKGYMDMVIEYSNRMMYYMNQIVQEGDSKRLQEFKDVVGQANGLAYEAIADIPKHRLGLYVENVNTDQQKQYLVSLADQMVKAGQLDIEALNLIIKIDNYKYAAVLMIMKYKQKQRQLREEAEIAHGRAIELKQMDLKIESQRYISKEQAKTISIDRMGEWDAKIVELEARLKAQTQLMLKDVLKNNHIEQDAAKAQLDKQVA